MTERSKGKAPATYAITEPEQPSPLPQPATAKETTQQLNRCNVDVCAGFGPAFDNTAEFLAHVQSHRDADLHYCHHPFCAWTQYGFSSARASKIHESAGHPDGFVDDFKPDNLLRPYVCTHTACRTKDGKRTSFSTFKSALYRRSTIHSHKRIRCPLCHPLSPLLTKTRSDMTSHLRSMHYLDWEAAKDATSSAEEVSVPQEESNEAIDEGMLEEVLFGQADDTHIPGHEQNSPDERCLERPDAASPLFQHLDGSFSSSCPTLPSLAELCSLPPPPELLPPMPPPANNARTLSIESRRPYPGHLYTLPPLDPSKLPRPLTHPQDYPRNGRSGAP